MFAVEFELPMLTVPPVVRLAGAGPKPNCTVALPVPAIALHVPVTVVPDALVDQSALPVPPRQEPVPSPFAVVPLVSQYRSAAVASPVDTASSSPQQRAMVRSDIPETSPNRTRGARRRSPCSARESRCGGGFVTTGLPAMMRSQASQRQCAFATRRGGME